MRFLAKVLACLLLLSSTYVLAGGGGDPAGLSQDEATAIANKFFAEKIRMEGAVTTPHLEGDFWAFPLKVGYAGSLVREPLLVNRFTGKATWAGLAESKP